MSTCCLSDLKDNVGKFILFYTNTKVELISEDFRDKIK